MDQWWSTQSRRRPQDREGVPRLGFRAEKNKAQLRGVDGSRREVSGMLSMAVVRGRGIFTGQIRGQHGVGAAALQKRPPVSRIREMDMEEGNRGNPEKQPYQNEQMPR